MRKRNRGYSVGKGNGPPRKGRRVPRLPVEEKGGLLLQHTVSADYLVYLVVKRLSLQRASFVSRKLTLSLLVSQIDCLRQLE